MWKFIKDFFAVVGGCFRFLAEVFQALNSGLEEVNDGLEKFNKDMEEKRLAKIRDNARLNETPSQDAKGRLTNDSNTRDGTHDGGSGSGCSR